VLLEDEGLRPCAGSLAHPFSEHDEFVGRMCQGASTGLYVDYTTSYWWIQQYVPELDKRCRPHLKACNASLNSSAGSAPQAHPIEEQVAKPPAATDANITRLAPGVITVEKNAASAKAMADLKGAGLLPQRVELRQVKSLKNLMEQDHRLIKRLVKPGMDFFSLLFLLRKRDVRHGQRYG